MIMQNSVQKASNDGTGTLTNTRPYEIIVYKRDGSCISLGPKKQLRGVREEDFKTLPSGVEFKG